MFFKSTVSDKLWCRLKQIPFMFSIGDKFTYTTMTNEQAYKEIEEEKGTEITKSEFSSELLKLKKKWRS